MWDRNFGSMTLYLNIKILFKERKTSAIILIRKFFRITLKKKVFIEIIANTQVETKKNLVVMAWCQLILCNITAHK